MSALRNSISVLDSSIKTLEDSSSPWEAVAIISAFVVFFGIIGELIVIVSEDRDDTHDWARGIIRPPDRPPRWRFWFDIVATVVVLAGVLGEAWASKELSSINSLLRSKTSELRGDSDQLLALITQEAGNAADSATRASTAADAAGKQADRIGGVLGETVGLVNARRVQDADKLSAELKKHFKGRKIQLVSYVGDAEAWGWSARSFVPASLLV